jgi:hypothetical protein
MQCTSMTGRVAILRSIGGLLLAGAVAAGVAGCVVARDRYEGRDHDGYGSASPRSDDQRDYERRREEDRDRRDENRRRYRFPYNAQRPYAE